MRRRVLTLTLTVAAGSLLAFGLPLALVLARLFHAQALTTVQAEAARVSAALTDEQLAKGVPGGLPTPRDRHVRLALYDDNGRLLLGAGPARSGAAAEVAAARLGRARQSTGDGDGDDADQGDNATTGAQGRSGRDGADVAALVAVVADNHRCYVIRAATPARAVLARSARGWAGMTGLGVVVLAAAGLFAARRSAVISRPVERLAERASALGAGEALADASASGVVEADAVELALVGTSRRLADLVERERRFSAEASHQLRTPLARLRLRLEATALDPGAEPPAVRAALAEAVEELDAFQTSVAELLARTRDGERGPASCAVRPLVAALAGRWDALAAANGRAVRVDEPGADGCVPLSAAALRHILDVLVDNALTHGAGPVRLVVRELAGALAVDVSDDGAGLTDPDAAFARRSSSDGNGRRSSGGLGLPLARRIAESAGGRLVVTRAAPGPVLTVILPLCDEPGRGDRDGG